MKHFFTYTFVFLLLSPDGASIRYNRASASVTLVPADGAFANKGTRNSDFSLVNEDNEDDVFHIIEIMKSNTKN
jgi:hypothetical protein